MFIPGSPGSLYPFVLPSGASIGPFGAVTFGLEGFALLPLSALNVAAVSLDQIFGSIFPSGVLPASTISPFKFPL